MVKRTGLREPFDRAKVVAGVRAACKNRPVSDSEMEELAQAVEDALRSETAEPTSQQVGVAVLERLQELDDVAYLRFASVYKGFEDAGDFQREAGLLTKTTEPKRQVMDDMPGVVAGRLRPSRRRRRGVRGNAGPLGQGGERRAPGGVHRRRQGNLGPEGRVRAAGGRPRRASWRSRRR